MENGHQKIMYTSLRGTPTTAAQLITEIVINNLAKKQKKTLPEKFWNVTEWKKIYKLEIIMANSLLRVYPEQAVVNAVRRSDTTWMTSLRTKKWVEYIKDEMIKINNIQEGVQQSNIIEITDITKIRQNNKPTKLDRLKDF